MRSSAPKRICNSTADAQCGWWRARPDGDAAAVARRSFGPDAWAERARFLQRRLVESTGAVLDGEAAAIADAFVVGAAALAHVRADPLLPAELCGGDWPGVTLRDAYREYQAAFSGAVRDWFRTR